MGQEGDSAGYRRRLKSNLSSLFGARCKAGSFFCTEFPGHTNCVSVFAPDGRGFFAEPQRGVALFGVRRCAVPTARGKRVDTYGFYPLNSHFLLGGFGADCRHVTAAKRGTAVGLLLRLFRKIFAVHRQRTATQAVYSAQARHTRVAQFVCTLLRPAPANVGVRQHLFSQALSITTR